ncbi:hypothetical protein I4U23_025440 [Adineta vaga]|nr:hypothetical protein I4U23_025440 [Adineta vaga]
MAVSDQFQNSTHQFQILRELCQLSISAVQNGLQTLYSNQLISGQLLSKDLFEAELEADIEAYQRITISNFWREFTFVRSLIFGNQLMSAIPTAFTIIVRSDSPGTIRSSPGVNTNSFRQLNGSSCSCTDYPSCHMPAGFYNIMTFDTSRGIFDQQTLSPEEYLSGWFTGCWSSESLLLSKPDYFYNQTVLNTILFYVNDSASSGQFIVLNYTENSRFDSTVTIETLVEGLFVEQWSKELNYTAYFHQCQPNTCVFEKNERASVLFIFTSLLGLYGGLSVVLIFITPYVVTYIMKRFQQKSNNLLIEQTITTDTAGSYLQLLKQFWNLIINLNIFKSSRKTSVIDQQHQRWSTRFYLILLSIVVLFLTFYTWFSTESRIIQIKNPSLNLVKNLQAQFPSLQCPCTELSISYEDLIYLQPKYHQICSSEFVTSKWIQGLNQITSRSAANLYFADFRYASPMFQLLKSLCDLTNETIMNELLVFGQTQLVTADLIQSELFQGQLELAIEQFKVNTPNSLLRLLHLIRNFTYMNQFLSGSYANFNVQYSTVQEYAKSNVTLEVYGSTSTLANGTSYSCSCANDIECGRSAALYVGPSGARKIIFIIPGFYSRCFPVESLLPSTMECFYDNNSCLESLGNLTNETLFIEIKKLNASQPSRFTINTTINTLLEQLFIETWSSILFYPTYFNKCRPISCFYTVITQKGTLQVVATITGLIGGLSIAFRLITPSIILCLMTVFRSCRPSQTNALRRENINLILHSITIRHRIRGFFTTLNTFEQKHKKAINQTELYLQRQSTRVYFLLLLLAVFILVVYTLLTYQQSNTTIKISSFEKFQQLQNLYHSTTVECPCTNISFPSTTFCQLEPIFHQICSSDFVSQDWLNILFLSYKTQNIFNMSSYTFIGTAFTYFQTLKIMCDLTKEAVLDGRDLFLAKQVVSAHMPNYDIFNRQTVAALTAFKSSLSSNFVHTLHMLLGMAQGNGLVSAYSTNWDIFLPNMTKDATIYTKARVYNVCNCAISASCNQSSIPYVPGYVVGCLPLQSLLRSTLECFYNQSCINMITSYVNVLIVPQKLNLTNTRFLPNLLIDNLVQEMFIEFWSLNVSYEKFFQQCQPMFCSYKLIDRYNVLYVVTTIVGLYGGLTVLLKLVVPFIVRRLYDLFRQNRRINIQVLPIEERY